MTKFNFGSATNVHREFRPQFNLSRAFVLPATKSLLAITLCLEVGCFPVDAIPVKEAVAPRRFVDWCLNQAQLPFQTRHTVDVLLKIAGTQDCKQADNKLSTFTTINLYSNRIADIKPLSSLTNLTYLGLNRNQIADIKPLSSLTNLTHLYFSDNRITDIKPLSSLTNLTDLSLSNNQIADIKTLSSLTKLTNLFLGRNQMLANKSCPPIDLESICRREGVVLQPPPKPRLLVPQTLEKPKSKASSVVF